VSETGSTHGDFSPVDGSHHGPREEARVYEALLRAVVARLLGRKSQGPRAPEWLESPQWLSFG